jgi:N-methylhydantoinase A
MRAPHRIVFAGPAAGTAAAVYFGSLTGRTNAICADIGGTSCDISVVTDGHAYLNTTFELEHDLVVNSLSTDISSIGAGGGSNVWINSLGEICVGPGSAGSQPGPACYNNGGTDPTVTDLAMLIGIVSEDRPLGGRVALRSDLAREAVEGLDSGLDLSTTVRNAWQIALNNITEGIFNVALKHGADLRDYSLFAFGAAGPMLLPSILDETRLGSVVIPPHPASSVRWAS